MPVEEAGVVGDVVALAEDGAAIVAHTIIATGDLGLAITAEAGSLVLEGAGHVLADGAAPGSLATVVAPHLQAAAHHVGAAADAAFASGLQHAQTALHHLVGD